MDTSETYIEMCDCPEIQGWHHGSDPVGFLVWKQGSRKLVCGKCEEYVESDFCPDCGSASQFEEGAWNLNQFNAIGPFLDGIWLPRQDQLQEMVPNEGWGNDWNPTLWPLHLAQVLDEYSDATYDYWQETGWQPESMEQLWLAFVMKEKYNKIWNGEVWDEITN